MAERIPISRVLGALLDEATTERVSLGWLMNRLGERSFDIILRNEEFRAVAQLCRGVSTGQPDGVSRRAGG